MATVDSVSFVWSKVFLLAGKIDQCVDLDDRSCQGGIAALMALVRHYQEQEESTLVINRLDFETAFVQMHPLGRGVNRLVLNDYFNLNVYFAFRSLLTQSKHVSPTFANDLANLNSLDIRPLFGNLGISTSNSWNQFAKHIHFDRKTGLAVFVIDDGDEVAQTVGKGDVVRVDQIESAKGLLDFIEHRNRENPKCTDSPTAYAQYLLQRTNASATSDESSSPDDPCWIPIVCYQETNEVQFDAFVQEMTEYENPPSLILQTESLVRNPNHVPRRVGSQGVWVASFRSYYKDYHQWRFSLTPDKRGIANITLIEDTLRSLPDDAKDEQYQRDFWYMKELTREAAENDPTVGQAGYMPSADDQEQYRPCMGGECPIGNLFTDATRWASGADFSFINSGGIRGQGWQPGPVKVSNIWEALPFANTLCTGTMSGLSVFRLFNFSTSLATFQTEYTQFGDRLLQVSGARITYNTQLNVSRLIQVEIMDRETNEYKPIERLQYYKFATDSWMCNGFDPFPSLVGDALVVEGEQPGETTPLLLQTVVQDYLGSLDEPYDTSLQGRLVNDTSALEALDWIQTQETCPGGTYWDASYLTCFSCPTISGLAFDNDVFEFQDVSGSNTDHPAEAVLVNDGDGPLSVSLRSSPKWIQFGSIGVDESIVLGPGQRLDVDFAASALYLDYGTAQGTVSFGVLDSGNFPGCPGNDATLEVLMVVDRRPELFKPGEILIVGLTLMAVIVLTCVAFGGAVHRFRDHRVVKAMQPDFLLAILGGILLLASSIVPMSIEDEIESQEGRNMACMATPWLLSMGFTVVMSALFVKLWRINQLFHSGYRRIAVTTREAALPFAILFGTNSVLLMLWTIIDPLQWEIRFIGGDKSRLYGTCSDFGTAAWIFMSLTAGLNLGALVLACYQAYRARKISSEYSESKSLGLALFCWLQILIVGGPVLFLISDDNPNAKYFLQVALIFAACLSMLLVIFGPIFSQLHGPKPEEAPMPMTGGVRISGLNHNNTHPTTDGSSGLSSVPSTHSQNRTFTGSSDGFRPLVGSSSDGFRLPPTPEEEVPSSSVEAQSSTDVEDV